MGILDLGRYKGIVFAITGFLVFIAIILAVNHGKAGQFADNVAGVKFLAEQRAAAARRVRRQSSRWRSACRTAKRSTRRSKRCARPPPRSITR